MNYLVYNQETKQIYSLTSPNFQHAEDLIICPECGNSSMEDHGPKGSPSYECGKCGRMFSRVDLLKSMKPPVVETEDKPLWVIRRAGPAAVIARRDKLPHATVYDPGSTGNHTTDRWTPEAEKLARLVRASEEMFTALKVIESKIGQIQRGTPNEATVLQEAISQCAIAMYEAENDSALIAMHPYEQLEAWYREGKAKMPVDQINHREFVLTGWRYFCMYSSARDEMGWHVYRVEMEESIAAAAKE